MYTCMCMILVSKNARPHFILEPGMGWGRREGKSEARWRVISSGGRSGGRGEEGKETNTHVVCTSMFFICSASNSSWAWLPSNSLHRHTYLQTTCVWEPQPKARWRGLGRREGMQGRADTKYRSQIHTQCHVGTYMYNILHTPFTFTPNSPKLSSVEWHVRHERISVGLEETLHTDSQRSLNSGCFELCVCVYVCVYQHWPEIALITNAKYSVIRPQKHAHISLI